MTGKPHIMLPVYAEITGYSVTFSPNGDIRKYHVRLKAGSTQFDHTIYEDHPAFQEISKILKDAGIDIKPGETVDAQI